MTPEERLRDDLERVKFCPHMDWQTNACSACRTYRLKVALEQAWDALARVREYADEIDGGVLAPVAQALRELLEGDQQ